MPQEPEAKDSQAEALALPSPEAPLPATSAAATAALAANAEATEAPSQPSAPAQASGGPEALPSGRLFASTKQMARFWGLLAALVVVWSLALLPQIHQPSEPYFDEIYTAGAAQELAEGRGPREITHPPVSKLAMALSLRLSTPEGERPFSVSMPTLAKAIRLPSILAGALGLVGIAVLGLVLFGPAAGLWAAFFLACDPFYLIFGRTGMTNSYAMGFALMGLAMVALAMAKGRRLGLLGAGLLLGLGLASRWTVAFPIVGAWALLLLSQALPRWQPPHWRGLPLLKPGGLLALCFGMGLLPWLVYYACFMPQMAFQNQWGLKELLGPQGLQYWVHLQLVAYNIHTHHAVDHQSASLWYTWPYQLISSSFFLSLDLPNDAITVITGIGNPLMWSVGPMVLFGTLFWGYFKRSLVHLWLAIPSLALWLVWARHSDRLGYNHYFLEVMPYIYLALGALMASMWLRPWDLRFRSALAGLALAINLGFALWMWPLVVASPMKVDDYAMRIWRPGWDTLTQMAAYRARTPMDEQTRREHVERYKLSLRSYLMGRKNFKQKAMRHDETKVIHNQAQEQHDYLLNLGR